MSGHYFVVAPVGLVRCLVVCVGFGGVGASPCAFSYMPALLPLMISILSLGLPPLAFGLWGAVQGGRAAVCVWWRCFGLVLVFLFGCSVVVFCYCPGHPAPASDAGYRRLVVCYKSGLPF